MKRYRFRLENVLRVRRLQEEQAADRLRMAQRDADIASATIASRLAAYQSERQATEAPVSLPELLTHQALLELRAQAVEAARVRERVIKAVAAERRAEWALAAQRAAALERLDERRREEHRIAFERAEAVEVDDIVSGRAARATARRARRGIA